MGASLLGLSLLLLGVRASAQDLPGLPPIPDPPAIPMPPTAPLPPGPTAASIFTPDPVEKSQGVPLPPETRKTTPAAAPAPVPTVPQGIDSPRSTARAPHQKMLHFSRDPVASSTQRVALQQTAPARARSQRRELQSEESVQYTVPTELPSPDRLFKVMISDADLMEMIRQEKRSQNVVERIVFPEEQPVSKVAYAGRRWEPLHEEAFPAYVIYKRLLFEQINAERYGWDVGILHPLISTLEVYCDVVTMPYHIGVRPLQQYDSDRGYCLPGDPVPLLLYPPTWCCAGFGLEAAVVVPLFFAFP